PNGTSVPAVPGTSGVVVSGISWAGGACATCPKASAARTTTPTAATAASAQRPRRMSGRPLTASPRRDLAVVLGRWAPDGGEVGGERRVAERLVRDEVAPDRLDDVPVG